MNGRMESRETRAAQRRGRNGKIYLQPFTYARAHMREFFEREPPVLPKAYGARARSGFHLPAHPPIASVERVAFSRERSGKLLRTPTPMELSRARAVSTP
jgi:hypothetical protein